MFHGSYFWITLWPVKGWDPAAIVCKATVEESYDECHEKQIQYLFWDNIITLVIDIYVITVIKRWAGLTKTKGKATDNPAA